MKIGDERPRLVVVEEYRLSSLGDPYLALPALSAYSGISARTLRDRLASIPHYKLPGVNVDTGSMRADRFLPLDGRDGTALVARLPWLWWRPWMGVDRVNPWALVSSTMSTPVPAVTDRDEAAHHGRDRDAAAGGGGDAAASCHRLRSSDPGPAGLHALI